MDCGVPYILETVFIILYITFFVYLFDKKTEGLIIIFLFILTFFAGFKTINDLYNLDQKNGLFSLDYPFKIALPLWILTLLPFLLTIISLLLIILTVSYIKKTKKNTTFGDIPFVRKPRKLLDDYKKLFISNFVFIIVFILGVIGLNIITIPSITFKIFNNINIIIENKTVLPYLFILYIIIFIISGIMLSNSDQLFKMRTNQLFADG
jgi:hypothetical protein